MTHRLLFVSDDEPFSNELLDFFSGTHQTKKFCGDTVAMDECLRSYNPDAVIVCSPKFHDLAVVANNKYLPIVYCVDQISGDFSKYKEINATFVVVAEPICEKMDVRHVEFVPRVFLGEWHDIPVKPDVLTVATTDVLRFRDKLPFNFVYCDELHRSSLFLSDNVGDVSIMELKAIRFCIPVICNFDSILPKVFPWACYVLRGDILQSFLTRCSFSFDYKLPNRFSLMNKLYGKEVNMLKFSSIVSETINRGFSP